MNITAEKNRDSWDRFAAAYSEFNHSEKMLRRIKDTPASAFHPVVWNQLQKYLPHLEGKEICVPSSGDNHAVFAFALMGAHVTSCDISEKQLENARKAAETLGISHSIEFVRADTMTLDPLPDNKYDFVYTSNGVHVWINDLAGMYHSIQRILRPGSPYMLFEIHPFLRPFDDNAKIIKPYDMTCPFEKNSEVTYAWRIQDILNALMDAGIQLVHFEEMPAEKDYDWPFWLSAEDIVKGVTATKEEVDRMHDWKYNPIAALPNWMCAVGIKN